MTKMNVHQRLQAAHDMGIPSTAAMWSIRNVPRHACRPTRDGMTGDAERDAATYSMAQHPGLVLDSVWLRTGDTLVEMGDVRQKPYEEMPPTWLKRGHAHREKRNRLTQEDVPVAGLVNIVDPNPEAAAMTAVQPVFICDGRMAHLNQEIARLEKMLRWQVAAAGIAVLATAEIFRGYNAMANIDNFGLKMGAMTTAAMVVAASVVAVPVLTMRTIKENVADYRKAALARRNHAKARFAGSLSLGHVSEPKAPGARALLELQQWLYG